ncbi:hypothetical protein Cadr_000008476 [Camelus dromedarius]|uniref:Uncharacterized protein n=1 Tax=Camelus dromedarius TaxID=9838 RepID=A0A5N4DZN8_CAMDR|nr:hypothetical protein Cadr_000008476 [Camelus dromedarius]
MLPRASQIREAARKRSPHAAGCPPVRAVCAGSPAALRPSSCQQTGRNAPTGKGWRAGLRGTLSPPPPPRSGRAAQAPGLYLCSLSRRNFSLSALLIFSSGCRWSWCVRTFWLST